MPDEIKGFETIEEAMGALQDLSVISSIHGCGVAGADRLAVTLRALFAEREADKARIAELGQTADACRTLVEHWEMPIHDDETWAEAIRRFLDKQVERIAELETRLADCEKHYHEQADDNAVLNARIAESEAVIARLRREYVAKAPCANPKRYEFESSVGAIPCGTCEPCLAAMEST